MPFATAGEPQVKNYWKVANKQGGMVQNNMKVNLSTSLISL